MEMKMVEKTLYALLLAFPLVAATGEIAAQPPKGSQLPPDENTCVTCHGEADLWSDEQKRLHISLDFLADDAHFKAGVNCHDCHGGNPSSFDVPEAHAIKLAEGETDITPFRDPLSEVRKVCGNCHAQEQAELAGGGVHFPPEPTGEDAPPSPFDCVSCHADNIHNMRAVDDPLSPANPANSMKTCSKCHQEQLDQLIAGGIHSPKATPSETTTALPLGCIACHAERAHNIRAVDDPMSLAYPTNSTKTCGKCHDKVLDKLLAGGVHVPSATMSVDGEPISVGCISCHAEKVHDMRALDDPQSATNGIRKMETCGKCHQEVWMAQKMGVHQHAGESPEDGTTVPLECGKCHGESAHGILPAKDSRSPVFLDNQVKLCGGCHEGYLESYIDSVHGRGLYESGLAVTASCASCHGAHGIYYANNTLSTLHPANVAKTCGKCHRFVEQKLAKSVHGRDNGAGHAGDKAAAGGTEKRTPSCTDCHQGHNLADPKSDKFRLSLPNRCGNCHVVLSTQYAASLHGQLTELGYAPGAKCSDCHGAHDILPVDDPESHLAGENRVKTCQKCHPYAVEKFTRFLPHADYKDAEAYPLLHYIHLAMEILLFSVFSAFGIHTALWFTRSSIHTLQHGRAKRLVPGETAYVRFEPIHRILHVIIIVSFLGLALTGLPLKYSNHDWAKLLARGLGGFDSTSVWHHVFAIATVFYFVTHLVWMARKVVEQIEAGVSLTTIAFGPDSPVPNFRDIVDVLCMLRWFVGLGPKPTFERWTYWEKFDYWAVFWGVGIIGTSGFMLWFPNLFCRILPGEALNVAKVIHSEEALLATGFIFAIHFFNTHLRADKFPMDMAVLSGLVSEEDYEEERPEYIERMRKEGTLEELRVKTPSRKVLLSIMVGGAIALAIGLTLLTGIIVAILEG
ncbi:MAG TPA: hypothetical protein VE890_07805 [Thermoguttaceae bacterium]|nr:hypothetical protein [Thermoguttaceae bacterium]